MAEPMSALPAALFAALLAESRVSHRLEIAHMMVGTRPHGEARAILFAVLRLAVDQAQIMSQIASRHIDTATLLAEVNAENSERQKDYLNHEFTAIVARLTDDRPTA